MCSVDGLWGDRKDVAAKLKDCAACNSSGGNTCALIAGGGM